MRSRLTTRLTAPIVAVSVLLLLMGVGAAWYVQWLQRTNSEVLAQNITSVRAVKEMEVSLREVRTRLSRWFITNDRKFLAGIDDLKRETDRWLAIADETALTEPEQHSMERMRAGYQNFFSEVNRMRTAQPAGPGEPPEYVEIDRILNDEVLMPAHEYQSQNEDLLRQESDSWRRSADRLSTWLLLLAAGGAGGGVILGWFLALKVQRSMVRIHVRLRDAAGKLSEAVDAVRIESPDEPGDLDAAADRLVGPINDLIVRLQRSRQEVLRAEQLAKVGQMAAGIAHEVRNPLMAIKLLVQTALDRGPNAALRRRDLEVLDEEVGRLEHLTRTFLDFARPPRPEKSRLDLRDVAARTLELIAPRAELHGVMVRTQFPDTLPSVEGDAGQMHQVLYNLLANALEVAPVGSEIILRVSATEQPTPSLVVAVEDAGPGLPEDLGETIFEPFVSTKETGMGLGLSICRRVVESHGGTIRAGKRHGGGATFTVTLPAQATGKV